MPNSSRLFPVLVLALSAVFAGASDASFSLAPVADPAYPFTELYGLSRDGSVALVRSQVGNNPGIGRHPYLWAPGGPLIERSGPQPGTEFTVLSGDGKTFFGQFGSGGGYWTEGEDAVEMTLPSYHSGVYVGGSSYDGGYAAGGTTENGRMKAIRWDRGASLLLESQAGATTLATGVSDGGVSVGSSSDGYGYGTYEGRACRWDRFGGLTVLPVPTEFAGGDNKAVGISADGTVILGALNQGGASVGCLWERTRRREFGSFPGLAGFVTPSAISADGNVVGGNVYDSNAYNADSMRAFVWDRAHGTRELRKILEEAGLADEIDGVHFQEVRAVASLPSGEIVVGGNALLNGVSRGFIAHLPPTTSFEGIGDLNGGGFDSVATSLSADGMTVGGFGHTATGRRGFVWTHDRGLVDLGAGAIDARGVSADGTAAAGLMADGAFRWNADGTGRWLGDTARAEAIAALGRVTVGSDLGRDGVRHAYRWNGDSTERYTTYVDGHVAPSEAHAVASKGTVLAGWTLPHTANGVSYDERAFVWDVVGNQSYLGDLPGGRVQSQALAMSYFGDVIVGWSSSANGPEAFRWTASGGMQGLGDLPGYGFASRALAVSADGNLIVGTGVANGENRAFLWDPTYGMRDLKRLLVTSGAVEAEGWTLTSATGVTVDKQGRIFVSGTGVDDHGRQQGFHASLPSLPVPPRS